MARSTVLTILLVLLAAGVVGCESPPAQPLPPQYDPEYRDSWITWEVDKRLEEDDQLKDYSIDVQTRDAVVCLQGTLPTETLRQRAEKITLKTPHVFQVYNNINVAPGPSAHAAQ